MRMRELIGQNCDARLNTEGLHKGLMFLRPRLLLFTGLLAGLVTPSLRADDADVEHSHDYPGFPRVPGFVITDYDEDNPAVFDFPVSRPLSIDADHVDLIHVKGHRYIIRYEEGRDSQAPSLLQTQQYYEKIATDLGFKIEKSGAVGDVSETFHLVKGGHELWVHLDPAVTINVLTIVEAQGAATVVPPQPVAAVPPPPPPSVTPPAHLVEPPKVTPPPPVASSSSPPAPPANPTPKPPPAPVVTEDSLYTTLRKEGRVVLPLTFLPGKPDLDADSQPVIDRVIAMMQRHPDLQLEIDGHTDNTGNASFNDTLSRERAVTVRGMLIDGHIAKKRLTAVGLGGSQPITSETTAEGREKNRRIELVVRKDSIPPEPPPSDPPAQVVVKKNPMPQPNPPVETDNGFHPPPDGVNYYPKTD